ncbi:MAG: type II toxin-antitoxin system RelE family toxin [Pseudonocardiaceae bacterium]
MSLYSVVWVGHAEEQFNSLSWPVRQSVMAKVGLLQQDPTHHGVYSKKADNYTTDFEYGIIVYAVVADQLTIIMLRVSAVD